MEYVLETLCLEIVTACKDANEVWGLDAFAHLRLNRGEVIRVSHSGTPERAHLGRIQLHCSASCTLDSSELPYICYLRQQLFKIKLMVLP